MESSSAISDGFVRYPCSGAVAPHCADQGSRLGPRLATSVPPVVETVAKLRQARGQPRSGDADAFSPPGRGLERFAPEPQARETRTELMPRAQHRIAFAFDARGQPRHPQQGQQRDAEEETGEPRHAYVLDAERAEQPALARRVEAQGEVVPAMAKPVARVENRPRHHGSEQPL